MEEVAAWCRSSAQGQEAVLLLPTVGVGARMQRGRWRLAARGGWSLQSPRGECDIAALDHGNEVAQSQRLEDKADQGAAMAHLLLTSAIQCDSDRLRCPWS
jgi:hypothetical protein